MYNQYNPYMNRFYGQQQANLPHPMDLSQQPQIESIDIVKNLEIPLDGSISYFPLVNGSAIVTKQLMQDGTSKITIYEPKTQKEDMKFATIEEFIDEHPHGVYLCTMTGHITCIIDGCIYDTFDCGDRIMRCAWKVE